MHQQPPQKLELTKRKIARLHGPHSFVTIETDTNVGFSDHGNIVSSVSDSQRYNLRIISFNQSHHVCLLAWRDSAANYCFASFGDSNEITFVNWIFKDDS